MLLRDAAIFYCAIPKYGKVKYQLVLGGCPRTTAS